MKANINKQNAMDVSKYTKIAAIILAAMLICALILCVPTKSAYAQNAENTFEKIYPNTNYFQSATPTLISANRDYLLIYDHSLNKLFVRYSSADIDDCVFNLNLDDVNSIYAVGNTAFIYADKKYFTIDLNDDNATAVEIQLSSPADISYFNSDGTYLYAKSTAGHISVYDENMNIAFDCDNLYNDDLLAGKPVIAGQNDMAYVFPIVYGNPFLVKYDLSNQEQTQGIPLSKYVQTAYVGDIIFALETLPSSDSAAHIVGIDKQDGQILFSTDICPDDFFAHGNRVFCIEGKQINVYSLCADLSGLDFVTSVSMRGADNTHFDNPQDIIKCADNYIVADSNNQRLLYINSTNDVAAISLDFAPQSLCANASEVYVADNNTVCKITDMSVENVCQLENIKDIAFLDKLYILTGDGVYTLIGDGTIRLCQIEGGKYISNASAGTNVYILDDDEICTMDQNGNILPSIYVGDTTDVVDFAIDYLGNIYLAYQDKVAQYYQSQLVKEVVLTSSNLTAHLTSLHLADNTLIFTADECFVGNILSAQFDVVTKDNYVQSLPDYDTSAYHFAVRNTDNAILTPVDERIEGISFASNNIMLVLDQTSKNNDALQYAVCDGKFGLINKNDFETLNQAALSGEFVATVETTLYKLPYFDAATVDIAEGTRVSFVRDCAGFENGKWVIVRYNNEEYFASKRDYAAYIEIVPEENRTYGKANADRVGGLVNVYAEQDVESQIVTQIVDGTRVEVLEIFDDFYLVIFDDTTGYVQKDQLVLDALTTVQIVAIVLCVFVLVAGTGVFVAIHLTRKKDEENANNSRY